MSSDLTLTGRNGNFVVGALRLPRMTEWRVNSTLDNVSRWGDSDSGGYTNRAAGRKDATFSAEGKYHTTNSVFDLFQEGDIAIGVLWVNATLYWDFPRSLCEDFNVLVNIDTEEVVGWGSDWGADGIYYRPGEPGATARTLPA